MPLYNRLKEYRARLGVNQQQMALWPGFPARPSARLNGETTPLP